MSTGLGEQRDDEPSQPLYDADVTPRGAYWEAYGLAVFLIACSVAGVVRISWHWVFPVPFALLATLANAKTRRTTSPLQKLGWLALVAIGLGGSIAVMAVLVRLGQVG